MNQVDPFAAIEPYCGLRLLAVLQAHRLVLAVGERVDAPRLARALTVRPRFEPRLAALLGVLERVGVLERGGDAWTVTAGLAQAVARSQGLRAERQAVLDRCPGLDPHLRLLDLCVDRLVDVLAGQVEATEVIFPGGSMALVQSIYRDNRWSDHFNRLAASAAGRASAALLAAGAAQVRILEVGAGTGGSSAAALAALDAYAGRVVYVYTDISPGFVQFGRESFAARHPFAEFATLDIERDLAAQGYAPASFDVVLATNVLHATRRVDEALGRVHALLRPGGLYLINEITRADAYATLTFGLLDGWWLFEDPGARIPGSPLLSPAGWTRALTAAGFGPPTLYGWPGSVGESFQHLLVGERRAGPGVAASGPARVQSASERVAASDPARVQSASERVAASGPARVQSASEREAASGPARVQPPSERVAASGPAAAADPAASLRALAGRIAGQIEALLGLDRGELDVQRPLAEQGVDSILAPRITAALAEHLGLTLVPTDLYDHASVEKLARHAVERGLWTAEPEVVTPRGPGLAEVLGGEVEVEVAGAAPLDIAIIGMSGRFPGARDLDEFWRNLIAGRSTVTEVPRSRWDVSPLFSPRRARGKSYTRWGGFLDDFDRFDPLFFHLSFREAERMSPQQRLALEEAWRALEDAGYPPTALPGARCGVFLGVASQWYGGDDIDSMRALGNSCAILPARISYHLDLRGPSVPIDTACSSSLVAIHMAARSIASGDCDMALAGGVSVLLTEPSIHLFLSDSGMASPTGRCHAFDRRADGFVPGEGVGMVVLRRLSDALRDGDPIHGVLKGSGINQDGKSNGITAPNGTAQTELECEVYARAGVDPADISYVEAHGTGTRLGDPIEVRALTEAFRRSTDRRGYCALGSVKTNIGHALTAAGVAGVLKVLLALRQRQIPASLHFEAANPLIDFEASPFFVPTRPLPWVRGPGGPRRAAVSSFGFSGTNAHVVIEEAPAAERRPPRRAAAARGGAGEAVRHLVTLSARTAEDLARRRDDLAAWLEREEVALAGLAFTLNAGRCHFECRAALVVADVAGLVRALAAWAAGEAIDGLFVAIEGRVAAAGTSGSLSRAAEHDVRGGEIEGRGAAAGTITVRVDGAGTSGSLARAAEHYVRGGEIAWSGGEGSQRRLSLPTYPFAGPRFWSPRPTPTSEAPPPRHPWLGEPLRRDAEEVTCPLELFAAGSRFHEHVMAGRALVPAMAYLELARALAGLVALTGEVRRIAELTWERALGPGVDAVVTVRVDGPSAARFTVTSGGGEVVHARGRVACGEPPGERAALDLSALRGRLPRRIDRAEVYARFARLGFTYGPRFRVIDELWTDGREVLARLSSPVADDLPLDPAILDGAVQAAIGLVDPGAWTTDDRPDPAAFGEVIPVALVEATILERTPAAAYVHVTREDGAASPVRLHVQVADVDGRVAVELRRLVVRTGPGASSPRPAPDSVRVPATVQLLAPRWGQAAAPVGEIDGDTVVVFARGPRDLEALRASAPGRRLLLVTPGPGFTCVDAAHYTVAPGDPAEHRALWAAIVGAGHDPRTIVHAWSLDAAPEHAADAAALAGSLEVGFWAVFSLCRALLELRGEGSTRVVYAYPDADEAAPQHAMVAGFARALAREDPRWTVSTFGVASEPRARALALALAEARAPGPAEARHHRGARWLRTFVPVEATGPGPEIQGGPYLITGGAHGVGLLVARRFAGLGARLGLIGRSPASAATDAVLAELTSAGGQAVYVQADVTDRHALSVAVGAVTRRFGGLRGVVHAAGVTRDGFLRRKSAADAAAVLAPKLVGTWNLDAVTASEPLDFFVAFSSVAGVFGSVGQTDYAAANRFLDAFAAVRDRAVREGRRQGKSVAIAWPFWRDGGLAVPATSDEELYRATGTRWLATEDGLEALVRALRQPGPECLVCVGDPARVAEAVAALAPESARAAGAGDAASAAAEPGDGDDGAVRRVAEAYTRDLLAAATGIPGERIESRRPLEHYGIDSMLVMRLNESLEADFGALPKTLLFEYASLSELADYLVRRHGPRLRALADARGRPPEVAPPAARVPTPAGSGAAVRGGAGVGPIAVVGISGRYPQAPDLEAFWDNLAAGRDCVTEVPPGRWDVARHFDPRRGLPGKTYSKWGGFLADVDRFDPLFFNIAPRDAAAIDPQERLFLEIAWEALENAGYAGSPLAEDGQVGVFVGVMYGDYQLCSAAEHGKGNPVRGAAPYWSIPNRVSYFFDFRGPSMAVDTACSSSLTAIHLACESLRRGECRAAIAGGVNLSLHPLKYIGLSQGRFAASDGRCHSFAAGGDGYVPGEGVGAVVLKPLADAVAAGDYVHGVILGSALTHGGKTNGFTVPSPRGQGDVIRRALAAAGVPAGAVGYIEAHGTGTALGDPIEIAGLCQAFADEAPRRACRIGSLKPNIGHLEAAAGIAGLTKVLLQIQHRTLVPTLQHGPPNPNIDLTGAPLVVQTDLSEWTGLEGQGDPLRAGVSSFGAGGANAHVIVEEHARGPAVACGGPAIVPLSAASPAQLRGLAARLARSLARTGFDLHDVARSLQVGRAQLPVRWARVVGSLAELRVGLDALVGSAEDGPWDPASVGGWSGDGRDGAAQAGPREVAGAVDVPRLMAEGQLEVIARLWALGAEVDWRGLAAPGRRVPLPGLPFLGRRCWIDTTPDPPIDAPRDPPVEGAAPAPGATRFTRRFTTEDPWVRDHQVRGVGTIPGAVLLEMAWTAACRVGRRPAAVREVVWFAPIEVGPEGADVAVELREVAAGFEFTVAVAGDRGPPRARGVVVLGEPAAGDEVLSLAEIRGRCPDRRGRAAIDRQFRAHGLGYGPSLQGLVGLAAGASEVLGELDPGDVDPAVALPPRVIDAAFQALLGLAGPETTLGVPFCLAALELRGPLATARFVHARARGPGGPAASDQPSFDLTITDAEGRTLLVLRELIVRGVRARGVADESAASDEVTFLRPFWRPSEGPAGAPAEGPVLVVSPADAVEWGARLPFGGRPVHQVTLAGLESATRLPAPRTVVFLGGLLREAADAGSTWSVGLDDLAQAEAQGVHALLRVIQALDRAGHVRGPLQLVVVTCDLQVVLPGDVPDPRAGALPGLARVIAREYPQVSVVLVDLARRERDDPATLAAVAAAAGCPSEREMAWRGGRWYVRALERARLPAVSAVPVRERGVYVIVGGAGGLGFAVAEALARTGRARVALIGRRPAGDELPARLAGLARLGGEGRYWQADATDLAQLGRVAAEIRAAWGPVHGVFHSALVLRDRRLAQMDGDSLVAALAPKAAASVILDHVFADDPLEFMAFFSSANVFLGAAGQGNYVAGCSFMDALASRLGVIRRWPVITINWGLWGEVGAVAGEAYRTRLARAGVHPIRVVEGLDALARILAVGGPQLGAVKVDPALLARMGVVADRLVERLPPAAAVDGAGVAAAVEVPAAWAGEIRAAQAVFADIEQVARAELFAALTTIAPLPAGKPFTAAGLLRHLGVHPRHAALATALFEALGRGGLFDGREGLWRAAVDPTAVAAAAGLRARLGEQTAAHPWIGGALALLDACIRNYPAMLRGELDPVEVLFPGGSMALLEPVYRDNPVAVGCGRVVARVAAAHVQACARVDPRRRIRVLEVGAGTGGTTEPVLRALAGLTGRVTYVYSDVSSGFLKQGERRFGAGFPGLEFALFDVDQDGEAAGLSAGSFDLVIGANVLHVARDLDAAVGRLKRLLRPGGLLLVHETTRAQDFATLVFGLTEGWWRAEDPQLRLGRSPLVGADGWERLFVGHGLRPCARREVDPDPIRGPAQFVLAGESDGWVRVPLAAAPAERPAEVRAGVPGETSGSTRPEAPRALVRATEAYLRGIFAEVLEVEPAEVRLDDTFERYGLESLTAVEVRDRLVAVLPGLKTTLLFEHSTLRRLRDHLVGEHAGRLAVFLGEAAPAGLSEAPRSDAADSPGGGRVEVEEAPGEAGVGSSGAMDIAIIGIRGRYPGGATLDELWSTLLAGRSAIGEVPADRWGAGEFFDPEGRAEGTMYTRWGGFIPDVDRFDPLFFGISPREAELMDPQERLFLEVAWETLEDAGYTGERLRGLARGDEADVGVFVGVMNAPYQWVAAEAWVGGHRGAASTSPWSIANRVSYVLDFNGPSMVVDTACSSSLTAVHLACVSLQRGECRAALAGGVNLVLHPHQLVSLSQAGMVSRGDQCRPFAAGADGFVVGEGVGAVLLKPLHAARRDGDRIDAVIRASSVGAGGKTAGYTVPNPEAQGRVIGAALRRAGVAPESVGYVEAHGTGTELGDPLEIAGLQAAFAGSGACALGSIKANIGHLESAAGIAALTKVVLQLRHQTLVPTLYAATPSPHIDFVATPFCLQREVTPWDRRPRLGGGAWPRRAGISSFGAGGMNVHVVVEEPPVAAPRARPRGPALVVLSASDRERLGEQVERLHAALRQAPAEPEGPSLGDVAWTLQVGRAAMRERLALIVDSRAALLERLAAILAGGAAPGELRGSVRPGAVGADEVAALRDSDDEGRGLLAGLLRRGELEPLARLWVAGADVPWSEGPRGRVVPLPTYPFRRERHWLTAGQPARTASVAEARPEQPGTYALFVRAWREVPRTASGPEGPVVVFVRDRAVAAAMRPALGDATVWVLPGATFGEVAPRVFTIRPGRAEDYVALLARVGPAPWRVLNLWNWQVGSPPRVAGEAARTGLLAVFALARAAGALDPRGALQLVHAFTGDDRAVEAAVAGFARSAALERPGHAITAVAVTGHAHEPEALARTLAGELGAGEAEVRHDGGRRLAPRLVRDRPSATGRSWLRERGVYLVSGGLGEVGEALIGALLARCSARVAILGRGPLDEARQRRLDRLRAGGEVAYFACDVADAAAVRAALVAVHRQFGALHGVLHLARTVADATIADKTADEFTAVLRPKVDGTVALDLAVGAAPLDFFVMFSSLAAWIGLAGASDYACACAFQDHFAATRQGLVDAGQRHGRTVAIAWPQWAYDRFLTADKAQALDRLGLVPVDAQRGLQILDAALSSTATAVAALVGDASRFDGLLARSSPGGLAEELAALSDEELRAYADYLRSAAAEAARVGGQPRGAGSSGVRGGVGDTCPEGQVAPVRDGSAGSGGACPEGQVAPARDGSGGACPEGQRTPARDGSAAGAGGPGGSEHVVLEPGAVEQVVREVFAGYLKLEPGRMESDLPFDAYGLDSIGALRIAERLQARLGQAVDPRLFFECPTLSGLCLALAERRVAAGAGGPG